MKHVCSEIFVFADASMNLSNCENTLTKVDDNNDESRLALSKFSLGFKWWHARTHARTNKKKHTDTANRFALKSWGGKLPASSDPSS